MTVLVDVATLSRIVKRVGITQFMAGMEKTMRKDFKRWREFDKCARVANHSKLGVIELMPISDNQRYAFKYVNGHPSNTKVGVPTVMAFGALANVDTGYPALVAELTVTTAIRTAVTSVMAASELARSDSQTMGMIGCGAQSEFQAIAFHALLGVTQIRIFDIDKSAMNKLTKHLEKFPQLKVIQVESAAQAAKGADIVTTCTADKTWATILTPDMVEEGMHINAIGGDCPGKTELHIDVLKQAKVFVEYEPQTRIEGDIQQLPLSYSVNDLWRVIAGKELGRENRKQITVFDSVGFALEDFSALSYLHKLVQEFNEGETINLVPQLDDPKDLFTFVSDDTDAKTADKNKDKAA